MISHSVWMWLLPSLHHPDLLLLHVALLLPHVPLFLLRILPNLQTLRLDLVLHQDQNHLQHDQNLHEVSLSLSLQQRRRQVLFLSCRKFPLHLLRLRLRRLRRFRSLAEDSLICSPPRLTRTSPLTSPSLSPRTAWPQRQVRPPRLPLSPRYPLWTLRLT